MKTASLWWVCVGVQITPSLPTPHTWAVGAAQHIPDQPPNPSGDRHFRGHSPVDSATVPPSNLAATALPEEGSMPWTPGLGTHSNLQVWLFRAAQPSPRPPCSGDPTPKGPRQPQTTRRSQAPSRFAPLSGQRLLLCPRLLLTAGAAGTVTAAPAAPGREAPRRTAAVPTCPPPRAPAAAPGVPAPRSPRRRCLRTRGTAVWELSRGASSPLKQRGGGERGGQRERERVSEREGAEAGGEERRRGRGRRREGGERGEITPDSRD